MYPNSVESCSSSRSLSKEELMCEKQETSQTEVETTMDEKDCQNSLNSALETTENEDRNKESHKMASPANLSNSTTRSVTDSSLLKAKRERVENIVTNIKDNPNKVQPIDLRQKLSTSPDPFVTMKQSRKRKVNGEKFINQIATLDQEANDENFDQLSTESTDPESRAELLRHKRARYDVNGSSSRCNNTNGFYKKNNNKIMTNLTLDETRKVLVSSLRRELMTVLDEIAENLAKRVLQDLISLSNLNLQKGSLNGESDLEQTETNSDQIDDHNDPTKSDLSENYSLDSLHRTREMYSNRESPIQETTYSKKQGHLEDQMMKARNDDYDEQTEALSLVIKRPSSDPPKPFLDPSANLRASDRHSSSVSPSFQRFPASIDPSAIKKNSYKLNRTLKETYPSSSSTQRFPQAPYSSETGSNAFRFPYPNPALLSSAFRNNPLVPAAMLRNQASYACAFPPQSPYSFPPGYTPFMQSLQQRNLVNAFADYSRYRRGTEPSNKTAYTRISTRDQARTQDYLEKQSERKSELGMIRSPTGIDVEPSMSVLQSAQEGLTPLHLKKAKIMFFYTRYPSANILKMYFPDVKFSRATTSQLIKWFSNFREFFYIQIEKFARQALSNGVSEVDQLIVDKDSELFRVLNQHYNKCTDFNVPNEFLGVTLSSLEEFLKAIQQGKDHDPSWKKPIYKVICKLDQEIPEAFKMPNVLDHLNEV